MTERLTPKEWELIQTLRIYRLCRHNTRKGIELYIDQLVDELKEEDEHPPPALSPFHPATEQIQSTMADILTNLDPVLLYLKWGNISRDYFGFSRGWIYQRLNGYDGNGNPCGFSEAQTETLRDALRDIAAKLNTVADNL